MIPNPISVKSEDAEWIAWLLIEHGWKQTSRRWRMLSRLPDGKTGIEALAEASKDAPWAKKLGERDSAAQFCRVYAGELTISVPRNVFDAFRKLGGKAW